MYANTPNHVLRPSLPATRPIAEVVFDNRPVRSAIRGRIARQKCGLEDRGLTP